MLNIKSDLLTRLGFSDEDIAKLYAIEQKNSRALALREGVELSDTEARLIERACQATICSDETSEKTKRAALLVKQALYEIFPELIAH